MAQEWFAGPDKLACDADGAVLLHGAVYKHVEPLPTCTGGPPRKFTTLSLYAFVRVYESKLKSSLATREEADLRLTIKRMYLWRETYARGELADPKAVLQTMADLKCTIAWGVPWRWLAPKQRWPKPKVVWE